MSEGEVSTNSGSVNTPENLKYLASNVEFFKGNSLLHQIVLDDSLPNHSVGERCLNAILLSISGASVNELNDDGYSALHLAVLKENVLMVRMLLSCVRNIDINLKSDVYAKDWGKGKNTALHLAVNSGNLSIIGELLKKGVDVDVKNGRGSTPLQLAVVSRNLETVKFLIEKGAIVNTRDGNGYDTFRYALEFYCTDIFKELIHWVSCNFHNCRIIRSAASYGNADAIQMLVDMGYDVNAREESSALHSAVESRDFKTIECLIRNGVNVNAVDVIGRSVLFTAMDYSDLATFEYLFDKCAHVVKNNPTLLQRAIRSGILEIVEFLLNKNSDVYTTDIFGRFSVHHAVKYGYLSVINLLLSKGVVLNVENKDLAILCCAARSGDLAVVELILDQCPDVNVEDKLYGNTPLCYAVRGNHVGVIKALLQRGSNVDAGHADKYPLHIAVRRRKIEAAQTLLEKGCQVNKKDDRGYTPLFYALENGVKFDSDIVNLLFKWGAVIDESVNGNTAVHYACLMPNFKEEIFNSLLKSPADACSTNARGITPLHCAANSNNVCALKLLVEKGADLNAKDVNGGTPLHYASRRGNAKFVKALLKRKVEVNVKGLLGRTPLHLAVIHDEDDIVKYLLHGGADVNIVDDFGKTAYLYEEKPLYEDEADSEDEFRNEVDTDEYETEDEYETVYDSEEGEGGEPLE